MVEIPYDSKRIKTSYITTVIFAIVTQLVEYETFNFGVASSNLASRTCLYSLTVELVPLKDRVEGSIPSRGTKGP